MIRRTGRARNVLPACVILLAAICLVTPRLIGQSADTLDVSNREAAARCAEKVERLQAYAPKEPAKGSQKTRFSEVEVNSFLALNLSAKYHPSLKSLTVRFKEPAMAATAVIDFDRLAMTSRKVLTRLLARLLSGTHTLELQGTLVAADGKGNFKLDEARFDGTALPNVLIEEIITAVGRKQKPPFDPLTPTALPYRIRSVTVGRGYIDVYQ